ncbi:MAG: translation elongation factor Ts [Verrucomicrobiia bacterium]
MAEALTINPNDVKLLREKTNAGMMDCKRALEEAKGDPAEAEKILRKKLNLSASKKASREAKEGIIASYIHLGGKVGVLVEVNCETDFVARNENFREFVKDITLHIAAANPQYLSRDDVPASVIEQEREIAAGQVQGKPPQVVEKIVQGKLDKVYNTLCLLEQPFIKDTNRTILDLVKEKIGELGENIVIKRFVRFGLGET